MIKQVKGIVMGRETRNEKTNHTNFATPQANRD